MLQVLLFRNVCAPRCAPSSRPVVTLTTAFRSCRLVKVLWTKQAPTLFVFVNSLFTTHIVGMSETESRAVLDFLYAHAIREEFTCRFKWEDDSVAMWDNRITQHRPVNDHGAQYRLLYRVTVEGDRPV